jgi:hypothetical protein
MSNLDFQRFLVVISFYEPRPLSYLEELVYALSHTPAGAEFDIVLIVNRTTSRDLKFPFPIDAIKAIVNRPNRGMNIGAWDHGWRKFPEYSGYLFVQDECELKSKFWLKPFVEAARMRGAGLIGESWNSGWDRPWAAMRLAVDGQNMPEHHLRGSPANRVDVYLEYMSRHGVDPGQKAGHLRSLVWFAHRNTLVTMNGFLHGTNYGECIASEIAATKQIESLGLSAMQVDVQPFRYFGHREWRQGPDGRWTHGQSNEREMSRIRSLWRRFCARLRTLI